MTDRFDRPLATGIAAFVVTALLILASAPPQSPAGASPLRAAVARTVAG